MNINDLSTQLLYTTVPIYAFQRDGSLLFETGFMFSIWEADTSSIPLLIMSYHLLENALDAFFELHIGKDEIPTNESIKIRFDNSIINSHRLGNLDLIALPMAATLMDFQNQSINIFFRSVDKNMLPTQEQFDNFAAIESVTFIGYPSNLIYEKNKLSVVRQGITATPIWNEFGGEKAFLMDAGVFPGSCGSPVFIFNEGAYSSKGKLVVGNRLLFVGVVSQPILEGSVAEKKYLNLGKVINSMEMYRELEILIHKLKKD